MFHSNHKGRPLFSWKTLIVLRSVVNTKSDRDSCVTNEKRELERSSNLSHLHTPGKSSSVVGAHVGLSVMETKERTNKRNCLTQIWCWKGGWVGSF